MTEEMKFFMYLLEYYSAYKNKKQEMCLRSGKKAELLKNI